MQSFRKVRDNDYIKYKKIYDTADMLFGLEREESFIMKDENGDNVIFYCPPIFMKCYLDEKGSVKTSSFYINEDYKIVAFTKDDYQININDNDSVVFTHDDGNVYFLQLIGDTNSPYFEVSNNGTLVFAQYDKKNDTRVVSKFEHNIWCDNKTVYTGRLDEPFSVSVESKVHLRDRGFKFFGHKKSYYKLNFDVYKNRWQYDLATMKDFGVGAVMASDTYSLQEKNEFSKYYKVLFSLGDYITITGFPFTRQYDVKEIKELIDRLGFSYDVPQYLLNLYNGRDDLVKENENILLWYLNNIKHDKKYSKVV